MDARSGGTPLDRRLCAPAAERNKQPILQELLRLLPQSCDGEPLRFLEVSSGTGQHISAFAQAMPNWHFTPTELTRENFDSIEDYCRFPTALSNVSEPQQLDTTSLDDWVRVVAAEHSVNVIYVANLTHISPYAATKGLFAGASRALQTLRFNALCIYGPFTINGGQHTSDGNVQFDRSLRAQNPEWGYRDVNDLVALGAGMGLRLTEQIQMPANNFLLVFERDPSA